MLRQLSSGARGFEAVAISDADSVPTELRWMDATGPDEAEMCGAARLLGFSPPVLEWLNDPNRSTRPRAIDDALTFALAVPAFDGSASPKFGVSTIVVAITEHRTFTAHDRASEWVVAGAARRLSGRPPGDEAHPAVLSVVEEIIDQYDHVVTDMGDRLAVHSTEVLKSSDRRHSPNDVVAEGLRLATDLSDVQRQLRRLRQALGALRALASGSGSGVTASLADSLDACSRALDALNVDLDALNHRLELTTDAQLNLLSWRQGEINKNIGAWAGVFAINAVITGFYGMNIKGLPGDQSWVTVAIIMASVSVALIAFFRKIDWL